MTSQPNSDEGGATVSNANMDEAKAREIVSECGFGESAAGCTDPQHAEARGYLMRIEQERSEDDQTALNDLHKLAQKQDSELSRLKEELERARANNSKAYCVYCGHVGEKGEGIVDHIKECVSHPLGTLRDALVKGIEQNTRLREKVNALTDELSESRATSEKMRECVWKYDEAHECWDTGCGEAWCFPEAEPGENGAKFCPHCGGKLIQKSQASPDQSDEKGDSKK